MENLLPPLLILLAVAALLVLIFRGAAKRSKASVESALSAGPDAAAAASARLTEDQHRAIYSLIARGLTVQAIAAYREATGAGLVAARNAVILMDRYPQQFRSATASTASPEVPAAESLPEEHGSTETAPAPAPAPAPEVTAAPEPPHAVVRPGAAQQREAHEETAKRQTAPTPAPSAENVQVDPYRDQPRPQVFPYRYRAIVSNGRETLEVASNMLNDEIYSEIKALAQIGDAEDAAQMLRRHSDVSIEDARAFVALL